MRCFTRRQQKWMREKYAIIKKKYFPDPPPEKPEIQFSNITYGYKIKEKPRDRSFTIKCHHCRWKNLDDGLLNPIQCQKCRKFFISKNGQTKQ